MIINTKKIIEKFSHGRNLPSSSIIHTSWRNHGIVCVPEKVFFYHFFFSLDENITACMFIFHYRQSRGKLFYEAIYIWWWRRQCVVACENQKLHHISWCLSLLCLHTMQIFEVFPTYVIVVCFFIVHICTATTMQGNSAAVVKGEGNDYFFDANFFFSILSRCQSYWRWKNKYNFKLNQNVHFVFWCVKNVCVL